MIGKSFQILSIVAALAHPALACLLCKSDTAVQVRAGIIDGNPCLSVAATITPFLIVAGVVAMVHFGFPTKKR